MLRAFPFVSQTKACCIPYIEYVIYDIGEHTIWNCEHMSCLQIAAV